MNIEQMKKVVSGRVRLRPAFQNYADDGLLRNATDDEWTLDKVDAASKTVTIGNPITGYSKVIGFDHIKNFVTDADAPNDGLKRGILVLTIQLYTFQGRVLMEPLPIPGRPLDSFKPVPARESVQDTIHRATAERELDAERRRFATSPEGIRIADDAYYGISLAFDSLHNSFIEQGTQFDMVCKHNHFTTVFGAFGYWAHITWARYMNDLRDSKLTISKLDGHPPFPGVMTIRKAKLMSAETYTFGLVSLGQALWISIASPSQCFTSLQLAERVVQDFAANPQEPKPFFE
ncbi:MAG: hypothetical protein WC830_14495 [Burkholderiales bacterium]|jgi:hypothetical protein